MQRPAAPLKGLRAVGRLEADGRWVGYALRGDAYRFVVGDGPDLRDAPADTDLLLALAIAHYADAFDETPSDLEATQSDLSTLIRHLMRDEVDAQRLALLAEALDAIDDGLAGDAVASRLAAARSPRDDLEDPIEVLLARATELTNAG